MEPRRKKIILVVAVAVIAFLFFVIALLYSRIVNLDNVTANLKQEQAKLSEQIETERRFLLGQIDAKNALTPVATDAVNRKVYIPEAGIALPYNDITKTLRYSLDSPEYIAEANIRLTSTLVSDVEERQLSCIDLVRVSFVSGEPYSPWEESAGSVELSDGRTMHIIMAKAYENEEASTLACASEVWSNATPELVAAELANAESY